MALTFSRELTLPDVQLRFSSDYAGAGSNRRFYGYMAPTLSGAQRIHRWNISATGEPTLDTTWSADFPTGPRSPSRFGANDTHMFFRSGSDVWSVPLTATGIGSSATNLDPDVSDGFFGLSLCVANSRFYLVNPLRSGGANTIRAYNASTGARVSAEDITLVSGAGLSTTAFGRLVSDGTHIWLVLPNSGFTMFRCFCYTLGTGVRNTALDLTVTFDSRVNYMTTDGTSLIFMTVGNVIENQAVVRNSAVGQSYDFVRTGLTYVGRTQFTYPSGEQTLHANYTRTLQRQYFASSGKAFAFSHSGAREASADITFENLPTSQTVWGFDSLSNGGWVVMTRQTGGTNTIGTVHQFNASGRAVRTFFVDELIQGFTTERFRAPKGITEYDGHLYLRVVRSQTGNMRWLKYTMDGNVQHEDLILDQPFPSSLSDGDALRDSLFIVQQNERRIYAVDLDTFDVDQPLTVDLHTSNTAPWAASAIDGSVFVADRGGYIYEYELPAAPTPPPTPMPMPTTGGRGGLGIVQLIAANAFMAQNMNRRRSERR